MGGRNHLQARKRGARSRSLLRRRPPRPQRPDIRPTWRRLRLPATPTPLGKIEKTSAPSKPSRAKSLWCRFLRPRKSQWSFPRNRPKRMRPPANWNHRGRNLQNRIRNQRRPWSQPGDQTPQWAKRPTKRRATCPRRSNLQRPLLRRLHLRPRSRHPRTSRLSHPLALFPQPRNIRLCLSRFPGPSRRVFHMPKGV